MPIEGTFANKALKNIAALVLAIGLQLGVYTISCELILLFIKLIGGCSKLGSLQNYCGGDAIPGPFFAVAVVLTVLLPPVLLKLLLGKLRYQISWRRTITLCVIALPLAFLTGQFISLIIHPEHGV